MKKLILFITFFLISFLLLHRGKKEFDKSLKTNPLELLKLLGKLIMKKTRSESSSVIEHLSLIIVQVGIVFWLWSNT